MLVFAYLTFMLNNLSYCSRVVFSIFPSSKIPAQLTYKMMIKHFTNITYLYFCFESSSWSYAYKRSNQPKRIYLEIHKIWKPLFSKGWTTCKTTHFILLTTDCTSCPRYTSRVHKSHHTAPFTTLSFSRGITVKSRKIVQQVGRSCFMFKFVFIQKERKKEKFVCF